MNVRSKLFPCGLGVVVNLGDQAVVDVGVDAGAAGVVTAAVAVALLLRWQLRSALVVVLFVMPLVFKTDY